MFTECCLQHWMIEALPRKISIPSILPMLFQKPCFYYCLFSSFSHSLFYFKLYKISNDSTLIRNLWLCGLIKYNRFQISGNKSNETEEVKLLRSRNWLYTIFIRKTNLKLDLLNFNIFESSEYEKMDIFLKQLNFVLLTTNFLRLLIYNKKYKNSSLISYLPQVLSFTKEGMCVGVGGVMFWQILPSVSLYVWFFEGFDLYYIYIYIYIYINKFITSRTSMFDV